MQAERYPGCKFTAMSNSKTQKRYIDEQATAAKLTNVTVMTADMNDFQPPQQYDRVISIEMFEHMKNYKVRARHAHQELASHFARCRHARHRLLVGRTTGSASETACLCLERSL